jgi:hypothetical protein
MDKHARRLKNIYYVVAIFMGYVMPLSYFIIRYGFFYTEEKVKVVFPIVLIIVLLVIRLSVDLPRWVSTWEPSLKKGLVKTIPKLLLLIFFMTLGFTLKYLVEKQIIAWYVTYFETIFILFGGQVVGSIFEAYHLKHKETYLISKGYVLGVVNK